MKKLTIKYLEKLGKESNLQILNDSHGRYVAKNNYSENAAWKRYYNLKEIQQDFGLYE